MNNHACLRHKFCATGKLEAWPLRPEPGMPEPVLRAPLVSTTIESLMHVAHEGLGIACLPDFMVRESVEQGRLQRVLDYYLNTAAASGCSGHQVAMPRRNCACLSTIWASGFFLQTPSRKAVTFYRQEFARQGHVLLHNTALTVFLRIFDVDIISLA